MNEQSLIDEIKRRNQDALTGLYRQYADLIYSVAYRVLNDAVSAEECLQDTFLKLWQNAAQFDPARGSLAAWLIRIARNLAIDKLRHRNRRLPAAGEQNLESDDDNLALELPDDWRDRDRADSLRQSIRTLPVEQVQVIELSYYGGMTQQDIAEHLKLPLGTVKTRMRLGMQKLRALWTGEN